MSAGALACGAIGVAAVIAAYKEQSRAWGMFWLLALFAIIGAASS